LLVFFWWAWNHHDGCERQITGVVACSSTVTNIHGITVAVVGVLVGTTHLVGKTAIGDGLTVAVEAESLLVLLRWKRLPEPVVALAGASIGLVAYPLVRPDWDPSQADRRCIAS
jgi:hypothetical protein